MNIFQPLLDPLNRTRCHAKSCNSTWCGWSSGAVEAAPSQGVSHE